VVCLRLEGDLVVSYLQL